MQFLEERVILKHPFASISKTSQCSACYCGGGFSHLFRRTWNIQSRDCSCRTLSPVEPTNPSKKEKLFNCNRYHLLFTRHDMVLYLWKQLHLLHWEWNLAIIKYRKLCASRLNSLLRLMESTTRSVNAVNFLKVRRKIGLKPRLRY